jgi:hypothetical protein
MGLKVAFNYQLTSLTKKKIQPSFDEIQSLKLDDQLFKKN